jgi:hypothetical protein
VLSPNGINVQVKLQNIPVVISFQRIGVLLTYPVCSWYIYDDEGQEGLEEQGEVQHPVIHGPLQN